MKRNERHINCYSTYELKARDFDPRDVGHLNFYLNAVDDLLILPDDQPTIEYFYAKP